MNTNQNARHIYKAEDIDWNGLEAAGISKKQLETSGDMELLLQGKETVSVRRRHRKFNRETTGLTHVPCRQKRHGTSKRKRI